MFENRSRQWYKMYGMKDTKKGRAMTLAKRTYSLPEDTLQAFEKAVPPGRRNMNA